MVFGISLFRSAHIYCTTHYLDLVYIPNQRHTMKIRILNLYHFNIEEHGVIAKTCGIATNPSKCGLILKWLCKLRLSRSVEREGKAAQDFFLSIKLFVYIVLYKIWNVCDELNATKPMSNKLILLFMYVVFVCWFIVSECM